MHVATSLMYDANRGRKARIMGCAELLEMTCKNDNSERAGGLMPGGTPPDPSCKSWPPAPMGGGSFGRCGWQISCCWPVMYAHQGPWLCQSGAKK